MVMDALRGYVQLASGLTEVTRKRAQQAAKALLQQTGAESLTSNVSARVSELADEIVATSRSNRKLLQAIVTNEVEAAVARLGFVRAEEVAALNRRLDMLEQELAAVRSSAGPRASAFEAEAAEEATSVSAAGAAKTSKTTNTGTRAAKTTATTTMGADTAKKTTARKGAAKRSTTKKAAKSTAAKKA